MEGILLALCDATFDGILDGKNDVFMTVGAELVLVVGFRAGLLVGDESNGSKEVSLLGITVFCRRYGWGEGE